ncbi:hypothetical protein B0H14DRAFT_2586379 [Mycena olivaceomarginata]|nr:hypothetical protein B0H14DRAFT_2586379 [Mycena olivaceomarginata]
MSSSRKKGGKPNTASFSLLPKTADNIKVVKEERPKSKPLYCGPDATNTTADTCKSTLPLYAEVVKPAPPPLDTGPKRQKVRHRDFTPEATGAPASINDKGTVSVDDPPSLRKLLANFLVDGAFQAFEHAGIKNKEHLKGMVK